MCARQSSTSARIMLRLRGNLRCNLNLPFDLIVERFFQCVCQLTWLHNKAVRVAAILKLNWVTVTWCYWDHSEVYGRHIGLLDRAFGSTIFILRSCGG